MSLISIVLWIAVIGIVAVFAWWVMGQFTIAEPIKKIITIALVAIAVIVVIYLLLSLTGEPLRLR